MSLCHLPPTKIEEGFVILSNMVLDVDPPVGALNTFLRYYKDTWLPLKNIISTYDRSITTTNACELFHRFAQASIGKHPPFWAFFGL